MSLRRINFMSVLLVTLLCVLLILMQEIIPYKRMYGANKKIKPNQLRHFTPRNVVSCLDQQHDATTELNRSSWQHFAFIGDSRIRQQFYNLIKLVPDSDRQIFPKVNSDLLAPLHEDVTVTSRLLKLILSFQWRPLLDANFKKSIHQWLHYEPSSTPPLTSNLITYPPIFILIGVSAHHMLVSNGADYQQYKTKLQEIKLLLNQLAASNENSSLLTNVQHTKCKILWLNQFPTIDFWAPNHSNNDDIHADKVHQYNSILRFVLKDSRVTVWDSGNVLVEEYVRSCMNLKRYDSHPRRDWLDAYYNCFDYIHTGYVALAQTTQILLNEICDKFY